MLPLPMAALENTPFDMLRDPDGLNLREYQIRAIEAAEKAIIQGKQTVLLSMATEPARHVLCWV